MLLLSIFVASSLSSASSYSSSKSTFVIPSRLKSLSSSSSSTSLNLFQQQFHQQQEYQNNNRLSSTRIKLNSDGNSNNSNIEQEEERDLNPPKQDVNNLFATYMAQRKDKGFMDIKYNIGGGGSASSSSSSSSSSTTPTSSTSNTSSGTSTSSDTDTISGGTSGNTNSNMNTSPPAPPTDNASFTYGMGMRTTSPSSSSSSSLSMGSTDTNNLSDEENNEAQRRGLGSSIGSSIPGIRRLWGGGGSSSGSGTDSQDNVVQHIPLKPLNSNSGKNENNDNDQNESRAQDEGSSSTKPPNPPSLLENDLQQIQSKYNTYQSQIQSSLDKIKSSNPNLSIPNDAENMLSQVIEEQMMNDVEEVKFKRAVESLDDYQKKSMEKMIQDARDFVNSNSGGGGASSSAKSEVDSFLYGSSSSDTTKKSPNNSDATTDYKNKDAIMKEIIEEVNKEQQFRLEQNEKLRDYQQYEESMKKYYKTTTSGKSDDSNAANTNDSKVNKDNFDQMQLSILQDLLQKRQQRSLNSDIDDEDLFVTDNIEDGIKELRDEINNFEYKQGEYKPESIKEWQMYRAIATKLSNQKKAGGVDEDEDEYLDLELRTLDAPLSSSSSTTPFDPISKEDDKIAREKVEAWKDFQRKEEKMRKEAGLAINYRPPFEWSDKPNPTSSDDEDDLGKSQQLNARDAKKRKKPIDREKAEEAYSELDDLALKVLNDLMNKTTDIARREKIRNEIEGLKEGIIARREALKNRQDYPEKKEVILPIDINAALGRGGSKKSRRISSDTKPSATSSQEKTMGSNDMAVDTSDLFSSQPSNYDNGGEYLHEDDSTEEVEDRPDSAFFREIEEEEEEILSESSNTFEKAISSSSEQQQALQDFNEEDVAFNLGTMEEQKFRSMVARSGVRSKEGEDELKQKWEDFQRAEQLMREKTGLSQSAGDVEKAKVEAKYDVDNIFKDGDIDADAILDTIGKRPSRKNRGSKSSSGSGSVNSSGNAIDRNVGVDVPSVKESVVNTKEIPTNVASESSVAVEKAEPEQDLVSNQSGTPSVKETTSESKVEFQTTSPERGSLAFGLDNDPQMKSSSSFDSRKSDLLEYPVLSVAQLNTLMGLKRSVYATGVSPYLAKVNKPFQDFGALFMLEGALVDVTGLQYEAWKRTAQTYDFQVPTLDDVKYASVHSEEFAVQKIFFWTDDVFAMKKVVDYFKETRREIFEESIKDKSLDSTRTSSSPQLNSDSNDSGNQNADVEIDVMNIQLAAWHRAARDYGMQAPTIDLLNIVGSLNPDEIVRSVFKWTNDFMLSKNIGAAYKKYLKEETSTWMKRSTKMSPSIATTNESSISTEGKRESNDASPSMEDYLRLKVTTWEKVAEQLNQINPSFDQVNVAEFAGPEKAVKTVFQWTEDDDECAKIVTSYRDVLKTLTQEWINKHRRHTSSSSSSMEDEEIIPEALLELRQGADEWLTSIQDVYVPSIVMSNFDEDLMTNILEDVGLSKFFPIEKRISSSSIYKSDTQKMLGAALRAERRPDHCVVFSATPQSAFFAHEVGMKNIALVTPYPYYELTSADMTVRDFKSIGMINLRNVFSETTIEEPMEQVQVESPRVQRKTLLKTRFWDD